MEVKKEEKKDNVQQNVLPYKTVEQAYLKNGVFIDNFGNKFDFAKKTINDGSFDYANLVGHNDALEVRARKPVKISLGGQEASIGGQNGNGISPLVLLHFDKDGRLLRADSDYNKYNIQDAIFSESLANFLQKTSFRSMDVLYDLDVKTNEFNKRPRVCFYTYSPNPQQNVTKHVLATSEGEACHVISYDIPDHPMADPCISNIKIETFKPGEPSRTDELSCKIRDVSRSSDTGLVGYKDNFLAFYEYKNDSSVNVYVVDTKKDMVIHKYELGEFGISFDARQYLQSAEFHKKLQKNLAGRRRFEIPLSTAFNLSSGEMQKDHCPDK